MEKYENVVWIGCTGDGKVTARFYEHIVPPGEKKLQEILVKAFMDADSAEHSRDRSS